MARILSWKIVFVCLVFSGVLAPINGDDFEVKLLDRLLQSYQKNAIPAQNVSDAVTVTFGCSLQDIQDLDPKKGELHTYVWLYYEWTDYRLSWNEEVYGGLKSIRLDRNLIWIPDIEPYNGDATIKMDKLIVYSSGLVSWVPKVDLKSSCVVDLTRFPYDEQTCTIKFGSWTYDGSKIDLKLQSTSMDTPTFNNVSQFELVNNTATRNSFQYACCPEPYVSISFTLTLKRVSTHATHMLVAPPVTLSLVLPVLFLLPPEGSEKLQLGIGLLVCHSVLLSMFASIVPIDHYTLPLLGVFNIINIILACFAIACCAVVRNIWAKSNRNTQMPGFIRTVFLGIFGRLLCVSQNDFMTGDDGFQAQSTSDKDQEQILESSSRSIVAAQWRQLAVILDRICFIIFVVIAFITMIRFATY